MLCCVYCLVDETDMMENPPFYFFPADRVCGSDCRYLQNNDISELASGLFDKLINLEYLCVALDAAALPLVTACCAAGGGGEGWRGICLGTRVHTLSCSVD